MLLQTCCLTLNALLKIRSSRHLSPISTTLPTSTADWHRRVWRLAGPIILSNMSVPLVGAVDTAV
ncbi:MAG: hypothetical protein GTO41_14750, partial [Burkholderiales bacterium]|nr:hypothetical protein [Burkholderiales bacterium]